MKKAAIIFLLLFLYPGCGENDSVYPSRPLKTPYFFTNTSLPDISKTVSFQIRRARRLTGIEFVVVILKSIPDTMVIGDYAAGLFKEWEIGNEAEGRGVLILFIEDKHALKIEVGYQLEGIFPDAFCESFQQTIKNYYAGQFLGDVFTGIVSAMEIRYIDRPTGDGEKPMADTGSARRAPEEEEFLSGGGGIIDDDYFSGKEKKLAQIRKIPADVIAEYRSSKDLRTVIDRYLDSLAAGINYPFLDILTEGSQMMRLEYPRSVDELHTSMREYRKTKPYKLYYKQDLVVARFQSGRAPPIFLRKTPDGYWKIDVSKSWAFNQGNNDLQRLDPLYTDHPWIFAYNEFPYKKSRCMIPDLIPFPLNLKGKIDSLKEATRENPAVASNYFRLADLFYWECYWIRDAIEAVEEGLKRAPGNIPYRWMLIDMLYRFPNVEEIPRHYEALLAVNPDDLDALAGYSYYLWFFSNEYYQAIEILNQFKRAEKKARNSTKNYDRIFRLYQKDFENNISKNRNAAWKAWQHLRIFHL